MTGWSPQCDTTAFRPIPLPNVVHPVWRPVGQPDIIGQLAEFGQLVPAPSPSGIIGVFDQQLTEFAEVVFEPTRSDDLDNAAGFAAGVPHRMHLAAGFGDVAAGPRTTSLSSERKPISPVNTIECSSSRVCRCAAVSHTDLEGMLDDRHLAAIGAAGKLEHRSKAREGPRTPLSRVAQSSPESDQSDRPSRICLLAAAARAIIWCCRYTC